MELVAGKLELPSSEAAKGSGVPCAFRRKGAVDKDGCAKRGGSMKLFVRVENMH